MMPRLLLMVGLVALVIALAMTGALSILRADDVVEVFPLPADVLDLPPATELAPKMVAPASATAPTTVSPLGETGQPTTIVLQSGRDNYSGCNDTYMQFYRPTENYCQSPELYVVTSNKAATLLRFDLTELPESITGLNSDAVILEATLELYAVQGNKDTVMGIYLPHGAWDPCAITWNTPWEVPGGDGLSDREQDPRVEATAKQATGWVEFNVTGLVQSWLHEPGQNYGMIIKSFDVSTPSHQIFFSSDHPTAEERPKLTIRYEPALPTPTAAVTPTSTPIPAPTPTPTFTSTAAPAATPIATPTLILPLSPRVVEVHWRNEMDLGGSYRVQVIFRPETTQATMGSPSPQSGPDSTSRFSAGDLTQLYVLSVQAQVTAPTFDVVDNSPAQQMLEQVEDILSWSWQVEPMVLGSQTLALDLLFNWKPATGGAPVFGAEPGTWYQTKAIRIVKPFRYWTQLALLRSFLVCIGLACPVGWYVLRRRTEGKSVGE